MAVVIRGKTRICPRCNLPNQGNQRRCKGCGKMLSKFLNRKVRVDGHIFDSDEEAKRYTQLKLMERAGKIKELEIHPKFEIEVNGRRICDYLGDFAYLVPMRRTIPNEETVCIVWGPDGSGFEKIVEDVKNDATRTASYVIKRELMLATRGIAIREV